MGLYDDERPYDNDRKFVWGVVAAWFGDKLSMLVMAILELRFEVPVSTDTVGKVMLYTVCSCFIIGFVAGIICTKHLKFVADCYKADFDKRSLLKMRLIEGSILVFLAVAGGVIFAVLLEIGW